MENLTSFLRFWSDSSEPIPDMMDRRRRRIGGAVLPQYDWKPVKANDWVIARSSDSNPDFRSGTHM
ncbi:MAG: hypothetical protein WCD13_04285, partial [Pseudolabrys sp.]